MLLALQDHNAIAIIKTLNMYWSQAVNMGGFSRFSMSVGSTHRLSLQCLWQNRTILVHGSTAGATLTLDLNCLPTCCHTNTAAGTHHTEVM